MKNIITTLAVVGLCQTISAASALDQNDPYQFLQVGYVYGDYADIAPFDFSGIEVEGNFLLSSDFFLTGKYRRSEDKFNQAKLEESSWQAGLGYRFDYSETTQFDTRIYYGDIQFDLFEGDETADTGTRYTSFAGNIHHQLQPNVALHAGLEWQLWHEGSDQKAYRVGATYSFPQLEALSVGVEYTKFSDSQWGKLFARYHF